MTRTPEDLRETFARHATAPKGSTARLQVVVDKLSEHRDQRRMHHRKSAPLLVSAAVVAVIATAVVLVANNPTTPTQALAGAGGTSTSTSAPPTPFSLSLSADKTEYSFPVARRQMLQPLSGPRLGSNGATLQLSDFRGKVVVINVWASWCAPCRSEMPALKAAYAELAPAGVQFLGIDIKDTAAGAEAAGIPYPSIFDPEQKTLLGMPLSSAPVTIVLDKQHRVAHLWLQEINQASLTTVIRAVSAEN